MAFRVAVTHFVLLPIGIALIAIELGLPALKNAINHVTNRNR